MLYAALEGQDVVLEVRDHEIGIPEESMPRLFDEFYRAPLSKKANIPGTGLGLPIVKSIAVRHKGQVSVTSKVGEGTTFRVVLPTGGVGAPPGPR